MSEKTYLVTGCSSGIGYSICQSLLAACATVYGAARRDPKIDNPNFYFVPMDLGQLVDQAPQLPQISKIDGIICAAGIMKGDPITALKMDDLDLMWTVHLRAHVQLVQALSPVLSRGGRIVFIGSRVATGAANKSAYAATKSALLGFSRSIAAELVDREITVNVVSPAATDTPMLSDPSRAHIAPKLPPMGRLIDPKEITGTVEFLLSDAARSITGQNIVVCAGSSLG